MKQRLGNILKTNKYSIRSGKRWPLSHPRITGFFVWTTYEISILHENIRKVRKEAWFATNDRRNAEMIVIKHCLEHLESRIEQFHGKDPEHPN